MDHENIVDSPLDDELQGALLAANENIESAGGNLVIIAVILGILLSAAIHLTWIDQLLAIDLSGLRHWYVYLIIAVVAFFIGAMLCSVSEKFAFRRYRKDILFLAERANLSKYQLIARLDGNEDLEQVSEWLKKDTSSESMPDRECI